MVRTTLIGEDFIDSDDDDDGNDDDDGGDDDDDDAAPCKNKNLGRK